MRGAGVEEGVVVVVVVVVVVGQVVQVEDKPICRPQIMVNSCESQRFEQLEKAYRWWNGRAVTRSRTWSNLSRGENHGQCLRELQR